VTSNEFTVPSLVVSFFVRVAGTLWSGTENAPMLWSWDWNALWNLVKLDAETNFNDVCHSYRSNDTNVVIVCSGSEMLRLLYTRNFIKQVNIVIINIIIIIIINTTMTIIIIIIIIIMECIFLFFCVTILLCLCKFITFYITDEFVIDQ
jgi:hypothetical protein